MYFFIYVFIFLPFDHHAMMISAQLMYDIVKLKEFTEFTEVAIHPPKSV